MARRLRGWREALALRLAPWLAWDDEGSYSLGDMPWDLEADREIRESGRRHTMGTVAFKSSNRP